MSSGGDARIRQAATAGALEPLAILEGDAEQRHAVADAAVEQIASIGCSRVSLGAGAFGRLARVRSEAAAFFAGPQSAKLATACPEFHFGFRPFGRQYSVDPERPDLNESFTYWSDRPEKIPNHETVAGFTSALHDYWGVVAGVAASVLSGFSRRFDYSGRIAFAETSYIETNWYLPGHDRDLLQDRHEDGHLLTIAAPDGPGLEVEVDGGMHAVALKEAELLVMPGSLMTHMTDGWIRPLFHQVRNHHLERRISILLLVNPPFEGWTSPFVASPRNRGVDIGGLARTQGQMFGLPEAPSFAKKEIS